MGCLAVEFREKSITYAVNVTQISLRQIPREQVYPLPAFIITARKSVDSRPQFYPWELFLAVFISSFSILRTSQLVWRFPFAVNVTLKLSIVTAIRGVSHEQYVDGKNSWAELFQGRLALNPGFFFLCSKAFSGIIFFSDIFRASNHQLVDKKN